MIIESERSGKTPSRIRLSNNIVLFAITNSGSEVKAAFCSSLTDIVR
ncbi:MAG: hypothetical protein WBF33_05485 [Candidatus Nitrosopolaris sp.]